MEFRMASAADLPQLKTVYQGIVRHMEETGLAIWDEVYPCCCFPRDVEQGCLYVLTEGERIAAAFALGGENPGESYVKWKHSDGKAFYLDRLGVNVDYLRRGVGTLALQRAAERAAELGAGCLRLFVVDANAPAIALYRSTGFVRAEGVYDEVIDADLTLREFGYEREIAGYDKAVPGCARG